MVCPINSKKRVFYAQTQAAYGMPATIVGTDAIRVIDVQFGLEDEGEIDRSDVWSAFGAAALPITGSVRWNLTVQTEMYAPPTDGTVTGWELAALFRGTPTRILQAADPGGVADVVSLTPRTTGCFGTDVLPFTVEIHEVNGTRYRATDCVATYTISAEPGQRIIIEWNIDGFFVLPDDNPMTVTPTYGTQPPLVYKNSDFEVTWYDEVLEDDVDWSLPNCPGFEFDPAIEAEQVPSACTPDGGSLTFLTHQTFCSLSVGGVLSEKPSIQPVWPLAYNKTPVALAFKVAEITHTTDSQFGIILPRANFALPEVTESGSFIGLDLTLNGGADTGDDQYTLAFGQLGLGGV